MLLTIVRLEIGIMYIDIYFYHNIVCRKMWRSKKNIDKTKIYKFDKYPTSIYTRTSHCLWRRVLRIFHGVRVTEFFTTANYIKI
jgi:hypothetical protein